MIAVDTSALLSILKRESDATILAGVIWTAGNIVIGAPTLLEARMVSTGQQPPIQDILEDLLADIGAEIVDFTPRHLDAATDAFLRFGKGRHPAGLNYGDCMSYAVARIADCPLLYKGEVFARTDIRSALLD